MGWGQKSKPRALLSVERLSSSAGDAASAPARVIGPADLSEDQRAAYDQVLSWSRDPNGRQYLSMGGLAGTGKTTLVAALARALGESKSVVFTAFTGRASSIMAQKLVSAGVPNGQYGTLHSLIYLPVIHSHRKLDPDEVRARKLEVDPEPCKDKDCRSDGKVVGWKRNPAFEAGLVVLDEASMVGTNLWNDLLEYGIPVLAVGDHGQLPPVGAAITNLMLEPDIRLEKVHRQAEGNPILELAHFVRRGGMVRDFKPKDDRVTFRRKYRDVVEGWASAGMPPLSTATICYYNRTRIERNRKVRFFQGRDGLVPQEGDAVICVKNNKPIMNGMRGIVQSVTVDETQGGAFPMQVVFPDEQLRINAMVSRHQFGEEKTFESPNEVPGAPASWDEAGMLFDFGYALTVHKSQGSTFKEVAFIGEGNFQSEDFRRRFVYTAVTRASDKLHMISERD